MRSALYVGLAFSIALGGCRTVQPEKLHACATPVPSPAYEFSTTVLNACIACHAPSLLEQQRLTAQQWAKVLKKMEGWGAPVGDQIETLRIELTLTSTRPEQYEPVRISSADAAAALARLPDGSFGEGRADAGRQRYEAACALCHGPEAEGGLGVNLVDRPILDRAPEFAAMVRNGRGRMPAFEMADAAIADLLAHLRRLGG